VQRREFLGLTAALVCRPAGASESPPIIDTHIHLFDPARPEGVPWPAKGTVMYRTTLPPLLREVTAGLGVVGAVAVECSPWLEDNQWLLNVADSDPIIVGVVGNLEPGTPDFRRHLERFGRHRLLRGIRNGAMWKDPLRAAVVEDLRVFAAGGFTLDMASLRLESFEALARLTEQVPGLRVVIDHLPAFAVPQEAAERARYEVIMKELAARPQVFVKVSAVLRQVGDRVPYEPAFYRDRLDEIFDRFGADRLLYGSDWPNSEPRGNYRQVLAVVHDYFTRKGPEVAAKYFWRNSVQAYRWIRRDESQPARAA
jgi:predicted TIM-barrel fold metal-dependent hydrolase